MNEKTKLERKAEHAYNFFVKAQPSIFKDKLCSWNELSPEARKDWEMLNDNARKSYAHFISLKPKSETIGARRWNKLTEAERHKWRMNEQKAMFYYKQMTNILRNQNGVLPWSELTIRQQHFYREQAMFQ